ncbi:MAG: thiamine diphosphokinase [Chloroflexota bacterium]|nr:thiamine diphosphokinase [Chloroflexota bacterium]
MRAVIFANGTFGAPWRVRQLLRPDDLIIAVDGGTRHVWEAGADPQLVVGDLDSLTLDERGRLESAGVEIASFSPRKDQTDLELAVRRAVAEGVSSILIVAALGGCLDQTLANVLLLTLPELRGVDVRIVEGRQEAFLIRDEALIEGERGDTVSLIPLAGEATGITSSGLEWPLCDDELRLGATRGVSNVLTGERASVCVRQGLLLCVVTHVSE